mmetsp:Transcript_82581/g.242327  ORF Transcript_82581/g.242327 Transcript_82581/m.242327 type:complete len:247 (+) Transcript_82581:596-1336(+)
MAWSSDPAANRKGSASVGRPASPASMMPPSKSLRRLPAAMVPSSCICMSGNSGSSPEAAGAPARPPSGAPSAGMSSAAARRPSRLAGRPPITSSGSWVRLVLAPSAALPGRPPITASSSWVRHMLAASAALPGRLPITASSSWVNLRPAVTLASSAPPAPTEESSVPYCPTSACACCVAPMMSSPPSSSRASRALSLPLERCTPRSDANRPAAPRGVLGSGGQDGASTSEHSSTGSSVSFSTALSS